MATRPDNDGISQRASRIVSIRQRTVADIPSTDGLTDADKAKPQPQRKMTDEERARGGPYWGD